MPWAFPWKKNQEIVFTSQDFDLESRRNQKLWLCGTHITDTVACVAGGLAGIYYGCNAETGIPKEWINQIARKDWIQDLCAMVGETCKR